MSKNIESQLANGLRTIYRRLDIYHDEALQISPKELAFLLIIEELGECRVKELAARINLPLSTVSWTADKMVGNKLISRRQDPSDRRAIILKLAASGKKALEKHQAIFDNIAQIAVTQLDSGEAKQIVTIINKVASVLE